jgi:hypothetical protein
LLGATTEHSRKNARLLAAFAVVLCALAPGRVSAAFIPVFNLNDNGVGSLRYAIDAASFGDTIFFQVHGTITLTSGELLISTSVTINGPAAGITLDGGNTVEVMHVA